MVELEALTARVGNLEAQLVGLRPLLFRAAYGLDEDGGTRAATAYGDLTGSAAGPGVSGLTAGQYVFAYGATVNPQTALALAQVGCFVNGVVESSCEFKEGEFTEGQPAIVSISGLWVQTLTAGSSTADLRYATGSDSMTVEYSKRWLLALRVDT